MDVPNITRIKIHAKGVFDDVDTIGELFNNIYGLLEIGADDGRFTIDPQMNVEIVTVDEVAHVRKSR